MGFRTSLAVRAFEFWEKRDQKHTHTTTSASPERRSDQTHTTKREELGLASVHSFGFGLGFFCFGGAQVCMVTYNNPTLLKQALESLLQQEYRNIEARVNWFKPLSL